MWVCGGAKTDSRVGTQVVYSKNEAGKVKTQGAWLALTDKTLQERGESKQRKPQRKCSQWLKHRMSPTARLTPASEWQLNFYIRTKWTGEN